MRTALSATVCSTCGESLGQLDVCLSCLLRAGLDDADGTPRFGDFEINRTDDGALAELGRGAMGVTYRARDHVLHRDVALKVIELAGANGESEVVRERFLREARAAAALRHPNIAGVFQFGASEDGDRCYCAMELVEGETLEARVRRDGPIGTALAIEIGSQVSKALIAAAERGLVHRDLKPGNIMLTRGDDAGELQVKVIDFGLAKAVTAGAGEMELTQGGFVGTPAFASPEQFGGGIVDSRSDIYALGVTLWFALTGRLPFGGTTIEEVRAKQQHDLPPVEQLRARSVPQRVINLLTACLALDPADRPSPGELLQRLAPCHAQPSYRRYSVYAAAALLLVAATLFLLRDRNGAPVSTLPVREKGLAVLPFENLSANPEDAFLSEGIQDDVLTKMSKIKDLKVIARSSVQEYHGKRGPGKMRELGDS
ncbi:MAG TPA: serine/threonine-protein kinase, partial [Chthoniobacterales bacterium]|nr:serine/threonine-protein kinase [Chthoniobacterales bacterium]